MSDQVPTSVSNRDDAGGSTIPNIAPASDNNENTVEQSDNTAQQTAEGPERVEVVSTRFDRRAFATHNSVG